MTVSFIAKTDSGGINTMDLKPQAKSIKCVTIEKDLLSSIGQACLFPKILSSSPSAHSVIAVALPIRIKDLVAFSLAVARPFTMPHHPTR